MGPQPGVCLPRASPVANMALTEGSSRCTQSPGERATCLGRGREVPRRRCPPTRPQVSVASSSPRGRRGKQVRRWDQQRHVSGSKGARRTVGFLWLGTRQGISLEGPNEKRPQVQAQEFTFYPEDKGRYRGRHIDCIFKPFLKKIHLHFQDVSILVPILQMRKLTLREDM